MKPVNLKTLSAYTVVIAALLVGWGALSAVIGSPALPMPAAALSHFVREFSSMVPHAAASLWRVMAAMVLGTALALPIGLFAGRSERFDRFFSPFIYLTYPVPKVVFLPVLMVLFGLADAPKIALIALVIFFQTLVTARDAARAIPEESVEVVRSMGATPAQIAVDVVLPASLADVFTALRINTGTAIAVLFLAESIAGNSGLGYYIMNAWGIVNYPSMFAGILMLAIVGVGLYELLNIIERRFTRWRSAGR